MITLYDDPFSPFARKVRMALRIKEIPFRPVDALARSLAELEGEIDPSGDCCDTLSIADLALFPHVSSLKPLGIALDDSRYPKLWRWKRRMRSRPAVAEDLAYVKRNAVEKFASGRSPYEGEPPVCRGDRIEWLLANGFIDWFVGALPAGRAVLPRSVRARPGDDEGGR
jgi:hypothetical protein